MIGLVYQSTVFQTRGVLGADASRKEFQIENARTSGGLYHTLPRLEEIMRRYRIHSRSRSRMVKIQRTEQTACSCDRG